MKVKHKFLVISTMMLLLFFTNTNLDSNPVAKNDILLPSKNINDQTLTILTNLPTTHMDEFKEDFLASDKAIDLGITDITFYYSNIESEWVSLLSDPGNGIDLVWGSDVYKYIVMEDLGLLKHIDNVTLQNYIDLIVPDTISEQKMKEEDILGDFIWVGTGISSFGFTVNHEALDMQGIYQPTQWEDLASPANYLDDEDKAIVIVDSLTSKLNARIYQIILQHYGWEDGWDILTRMAANAEVYTSSVAARTAVVWAENSIVLSSETYGIIARMENPHCEYIVPVDAASLFPKPIALAINVDNQTAAESFIEYVLSAEAQAIWLIMGIDCLPINTDAFQTPFGLTRTDIYSIYNDTIDTEAVNFNYTLGFQNYETSMNYFHQTLVEPHSLLSTTWGEMINQLSGGSITMQEFADYVDDLIQVNMTLAESIEWNEQYKTDSIFADLKDSEWRTFAENKYNDIYFDLTGGFIDEYNKISFIVLPILLIELIIVLRRKKKN